MSTDEGTVTPAAATATAVGIVRMEAEEGLEGAVGVPMGGAADGSARLRRRMPNEEDPTVCCIRIAFGGICGTESECPAVDLAAAGGGTAEEEGENGSVNPSNAARTASGDTSPLVRRGRMPATRPADADRDDLEPPAPILPTALPPDDARAPRPRVTAKLGVSPKKTLSPVSPPAAPPAPSELSGNSGKPPTTAASSASPSPPAPSSLPSGNVVSSTAAAAASSRIITDAVNITRRSVLPLRESPPTCGPPPPPPEGCAFEVSSPKAVEAGPAE